MVGHYEGRSVCAERVQYVASVFSGLKIKPRALQSASPLASLISSGSESLCHSTPVCLCICIGVCDSPMTSSGCSEAALRLYVDRMKMIERSAPPALRH